LDSGTGELTLIVINKDPDHETIATINIEGYTPSKAEVYQYSGEDLMQILPRPDICCACGELKICFSALFGDLDEIRKGKDIPGWRCEW
jgi:hypothetical protein